MTAATLFTPIFPPQFDDVSTDADLDNHALETDRDSMEYDEVDDEFNDTIDTVAGSEHAGVDYGSADYGNADYDSAEKSAKAQASTETAIFRKLQKKLRRQVSWAIRDFNMIEDGDVVMVCVSGGKDSYTLLDILLLLKRIAPINFDIVAVNLDQKQPGYPEDILPAYLNEQGIAHYILEKDTYSIVKSVVPGRQDLLLSMFAFAPWLVIRFCQTNWRN